VISPSFSDTRNFFLTATVVLLMLTLGNKTDLRRPRYPRFALDRSEQAKEVVELIAESLTLAETPMNKKIARLFLVSDILYATPHSYQRHLIPLSVPRAYHHARTRWLSFFRHNSSAPVRNASMYRSAFQKVLPAIFESITTAYVRNATTLTYTAHHRIELYRLTIAPRLLCTIRCGSLTRLYILIGTRA
jgi:hypothetical protein